MAVDTLKLYERLRKADLSDAASREIAEGIKEGGEQGRETLATKDDLKSEIANLKEDIAALRADTKVDLANLKVELIKWMIAIGIAGFTALLGLLKIIKVL